MELLCRVVCNLFLHSQVKMRKESEQHMEDMRHQWVADCIGCGPVQLETWIVGIPTEQLVGLSTELDYKSIGWEARQTYFLIQCQWNCNLVPRLSPAPFSWSHTWILNHLEKCFSRQFKVHVCNEENGMGDGPGPSLREVTCAVYNWWSHSVIPEQYSISRLPMQVTSQLVY